MILLGLSTSFCIDTPLKAKMNSRAQQKCAHHRKEVGHDERCNCEVITNTVVMRMEGNNRSCSAHERTRPPDFNEKKTFFFNGSSKGYGARGPVVHLESREEREIWH